MNKETKSKCCYYNEDCPICPKVPQEDTPVTPIEGKKLRYQINKIRNGCWRLEWEDGSFSEHSTQDGAERMRMQIETSRASHPIEPSWEEQYNKLFDRHFQAKYSDIKAFIHSVEKAAEEKAKEGIIQDILELCRYNGEIQSVDILKYAKANGISLQVK